MRMRIGREEGKIDWEGKEGTERIEEYRIGKKIDGNEDRRREEYSIIL